MFYVEFFVEYLRSYHGFLFEPNRPGGSQPGGKIRDIQFQFFSFKKFILSNTTASLDKQF